MFFRLFPRANQTDPAAVRFSPWRKRGQVQFVWKTLRAAARQIGPVPFSAAPRQVIAGKAFATGLHFRRGALKDDASAAFARAGADFHDLVGRADQRLLVLDDHHGVAAVTKTENRSHEAMDVAGVKANRRLVQDVERVYQAGTEGRRERDPPRLAAAERSHHAIERQVAQPDGLKIVESRSHLFQHRASDTAVVGGEQCSPLPLGEGQRVRDVDVSN